MELVECGDKVVDRTITAAIDVHKTLGPGLFESVYEQALAIELEAVGIKARRQVEIPVSYRGEDLGVGFRADIVVDDCLLLELKAVERLNNKHVAQAMCYLKLLNFKRGFLLNFNEAVLKNGIRRVSI